MSKLDELIKKYCPDGVEYKPLWEVTIWDKKFNAVDKSKQKKVYNYPYLLAKDLFSIEVPDGNVFLLSTGEQTGWTTEKLAGDNLREGEVVTIPWGKSRAVVDCIKYYKGKFVTADNRIMTSGDVEILSNKYLYYCIMTKGELIDSFYRGSGIKHPDMSKVLDMKIPVPPLPVQEEIVRMLDSFTSLTAELQDKLNTEFQARRKQYEYYASNLFDKASIEWKSMGDIASFVYGYTDKAQDTGDTRFIRITDIDEQGHLKNEEPKYITINNEAKKSLLSYGDLIMARTGATYGKTLYFESEFPSVYASFLIKIIPNKNIILNKYYWHFTRTSFYWEQANRLVTTGGQPQFNTPAIKQIKIPVPSIDVQKQIINILDKFDSLINDLTTGLPAEIAARQKQYEYYRDKLLTFKELS